MRLMRRQELEGREEYWKSGRLFGWSLCVSGVWIGLLDLNTLPWRRVNVLVAGVSCCFVLLLQESAVAD